MTVQSATPGKHSWTSDDGHGHCSAEEVKSELCVDVLVVGAGVSGVGMACRLRRDHPELEIAIVERRDRMGGTWDLFRYPGVRTDSDMITFGYDFKPWNDPRILTDGQSIREYMQEAADEFGVTERIQYGLHVKSASWSSATQRWTSLAVDSDGDVHIFVAKFVVGATGYYNYDQGYRPSFPNEEVYRGLFVHPQQWPEDLDYRDKKIAVIGSGATAMTIVPNIADEAQHVTLIQRSPTYVLPLPTVNPVMRGMQSILPGNSAYYIVRTLRILGFRALVVTAIKRPEIIRAVILALVKSQLDDKSLMKHFTPRYNPMDQRVCMVADGDLFKCINAGSVSMETDTIQSFTESGIQLSSGRHVEADIVITATGLDVVMNGEIEASIDGKPLDASSLMTYKAVQLQNVPNFASIFGYTTESWTLKASAAAEYVCRLIEFMDKNDYGMVTPRADDTVEEGEGSVFGTLTSGYIQRAGGQLPKQGRSGFWRVTHSYITDFRVLRLGKIRTKELEFVRKVNPTNTGSGAGRRPARAGSDD